MTHQDRIDQLDALVAQFDLNAHRFYIAWRAGTVSRATLADYADGYGRFVATIATGWESLCEHEYAAEERVHEGLWADFQSELGATGKFGSKHVDTLVTAGQNLFCTKPEAVGALYAFEAQQPATAQSKLDGLTEHYGFSVKGKEYFAVHAGDVHEVDTLKEYVGKLSDVEFERARSACAVLCAAMWSGLDAFDLAA